MKGTRISSILMCNCQFKGIPNLFATIKYKYIIEIADGMSTELCKCYSSCWHIAIISQLSIIIEMPILENDLLNNNK